MDTSLVHFNDVSVWTMIGSLVFDIHWTLSLCLEVNLNRKVGFEELGGIEWESECAYIM